jgi:hypothetical protein
MLLQLLGSDITSICITFITYVYRIWYILNKELRGNPYAIYKLIFVRINMQCLWRGNVQNKLSVLLQINLDLGERWGVVVIYYYYYYHHHHHHHHYSLAFPSMSVNTISLIF